MLRCGLRGGWVLALAVSAAAGGPGKSGEDDLQTLILKKLDAKNPAGCLEGIDTALRWGPKAAPAAEPLAALLECDNVEIRISAGFALAAIGKASLPHVTPRLEHKDAATRLYAVWALGHLGRDAAAAAAKVARLLKDADADVRRKAAYALSRIQTDDEKAAHAVAALFADKEADVRNDAREAIMRFGDRAIPALSDALKHPEAVARSQSLTAIHTFLLLKKHPTLVPVLRESLLASRHDEVRYDVVQMLGQLRLTDKESVATFAQGLSDRYGGVRIQCAIALNAAGAETKPWAAELVEALYDDHKMVQDNAWGALRSFGHDPRPVLLPRLKDRDLKRRVATARIYIDHLGEHEPAVPVLTPALGAKVLEDRLAAALVLSRTKFEKDKLRATLDELVRHDNDGIRTAALPGLANLIVHDEKAVPLMVGLLDDKVAANRFAAAKSLRSIGPKAKPAHDALVRRLKDDAYQVRHEALFALAAAEADPALCLPHFKAMLMDKTYYFPVFHHFTYDAAAAWSARLFTLALDDADPEFRLRLTGIIEAGRFSHPALMLRLERAALTDDEKRMRMSAAYCLVYTGVPALHHVMNCFHSDDPAVRGAAEYAVYARWANVPAIVPHIIALLGDKKVATRRSVLDACRPMGVKAWFARAEIKFLALADPDALNRNKAAALLDEMDRKK